MKKHIWLLVGILVFIILQLVPAPGGMPQKAWNVISVASLMTILWISETIDLGVTALLPIVLFPVLGISPFKTVTLQYANETIFLFMGGFMLALALEKSRVHERFALYSIRLIGGTPGRVMLGFMIVIFILSMWVSNTAAVLMIIPVCNAVVERMKSRALPGDMKAIEQFSKALYLSLAYAASLGGIGTLIGTPPNIVLASIVSEQAHVQIPFIKWMIFATPPAFIFLILTWLYLSRVTMTAAARNLSIDTNQITGELDKLGPMSTHEKRVTCVFAAVVLLWTIRGLIDIPFFHTISDTTIAIAGAVVLFLIPCKDFKGERLLEWKNAAPLPWNILLLFGGGLALAEGFTASGLSASISSWVSGMQNVNISVFLFLITLITVIMTTLMPNTATANLLIPLSISIAGGLGCDPLICAIPVAISASCAFMLPVSTPPNAIVYGYGFIKVKDMALTGIAINIIGIVITMLISYFLVPVIF